jgi:hypothetical protein
MSRQIKLPRVDENALVLLQKEAKTVIIFGRIEYVDAFNEPRWTDVRLLLRNAVNRGPVVVPWETGNDTY